MIGPKYGDFHIQRNWTQNDIRVLELAQDSNAVLHLAVRKFAPSPEERRSDDTRGNKMYSIPWAIADPERATETVNCYLDHCIEEYLDAVLDDSNHLVWDIFHWAFKLSLFPQPNKLLSDVIRLWVACRFLEGRWRCVGSNTFGAENLFHWYGMEQIVQVPPFVNYQMAAIFTEKILQPLRITVLKQLQDLILANQKKNWFTITLSVFILLHNYELQCQFHRAFARRRGFSVRFVEMPVIRAIHSGAKTILAYFHYACKGQRPFSLDHDWSTDEARGMAHLDDEQITFLEQYRLRIQNNVQIQTVSQSHDYEAEYWFVGQMFDAEWVPRQTNESSLPA
ncbi:Clavaminate synthase [Fusarium albosuccineum]|uniref:Clavaminate synthase n=1 Tax=Fusarium albosuccineum TaxID=1237068 RepID=A0A8H4LM91_9HYPO|nr:Clavaminate synthase [Fusarium albosuccineum]